MPVQTRSQFQEVTETKNQKEKILKGGRSEQEKKNHPKKTKTNRKKESSRKPQNEDEPKPVNEGPFDIKRYPEWVQQQWPSILKMAQKDIQKEGALSIIQDAQNEIYNGNGYATQIIALTFLHWAQEKYPKEYTLRCTPPISETKSKSKKTKSGNEKKSNDPEKSTRATRSGGSGVIFEPEKKVEIPKGAVDCSGLLFGLDHFQLALRIAKVLPLKYIHKTTEKMSKTKLGKKVKLFYALGDKKESISSKKKVYVVHLMDSRHPPRVSLVYFLKSIHQSKW